MKKVNTLCKFAIAICLIFTLTMVICNCVNAVSISVPPLTPTGPTSRINIVGSRILWVLQLCFYAAAVIIVMFTGVKYMYSAPEAKAELKKKMIYLVTGAVMLFAAGGIVQIIANITVNNL